MAATFCLDCRRRIDRGSRCPRCERARFPASPGRLRGRAGQRLRADLLKAYAFKCARCGAEHKPLEVHHRDRDDTNNSPANLVPLCKSCHAKAGLRLF